MSYLTQLLSSTRTNVTVIQVLSTTAKPTSEAPTRNFAKLVSSKEVDEAIQGAFQKKHRRIAYIMPICGKNG